MDIRKTVCRLLVKEGRMCPCIILRIDNGMPDCVLTNVPPWGNLISLSRCGNDRFIGDQKHLLGFWKAGIVRQNIHRQQRAREALQHGEDPCGGDGGVSPALTFRVLGRRSGCCGEWEWAFACKAQTLPETKTLMGRGRGRWCSILVPVLLLSFP